MNFTCIKSLKIISSGTEREHVCASEVHLLHPVINLGLCQTMRLVQDIYTSTIASAGALNTINHCFQQRLLTQKIQGYNHILFYVPELLRLNEITAAAVTGDRFEIYGGSGKN